MDTISIIVNILSFLIGVIFGGGAIWKYKESKREDVKLVMKLRAELGDKLSLLIEDSVFYADLRDGKVKPTTDQNQLLQLRQKINLQKDDVLEIERRLSKVEGREIRNINVQYIRPPAQKNLVIRKCKKG